MPYFKRLQSKSALLILLFRIISCIILAVIIANPSRMVRIPSTADFKLVTLIDASKSMMTADEHNSSRLQKVATVMNDATVIDNLQNFAKNDTFLFADDFTPTTLPFAVQPLPGNTNLGDALSRVLQTNALGLPVGAVLLLSDGRSNDGPSPQNVAKQLAAADIPVTTVLVGEKSRPLDISVSTLEQNLQVKRDAPFTLTAQVSANNTDAMPVNVQLLQNAVVLQETTIQLPPRADKTPVPFTVTSPNAGLQTYVVRVAPTAQDASSDNNADFVTVHVEQPPVFKLLYLANTLDWDWRFLSKIHEDVPSVETSALILLGRLPDNPQKLRFFTQGVPSEIDAFPEQADFYAPFDAIVADTRVFSDFPEPALQAIVSFVANKGGGLLLKGPADNLPETVATMLPAREFAVEFVNSPVKLIPNPQFIFTRNPSSKLLSDNLFAPLLSPLAAMPELKKSARSAMDLQTPRGKASALAAHAYGAGRVVYLASTATWKWKLASDSSAVLYNDFWLQLASFLAETGKPRFNCLNNGLKYPVDQSSDILLDVLGPDFLPAPDARVSLSVTAPDAAVTTLHLSPSLHELGRYEVPFTPSMSGEYLLLFEIRFDDAVHTSQAVMIAKPMGQETSEIAPDPAMMEDIARITSGHSLSLAELTSALHSPSAFSRAVPLSTRIPFDEIKTPFIPPALLYALLFLSCMAAWWLRRRLSLK